MGGAFSLVADNHIYNINNDEPFGGAEVAGIKLHGAIDTTVRDNHIHNAPIGIWLDWMAQCSRTTGNLCYNIRMMDFFTEVNHGPYLVDNNIFLSDTALRDMSQGGAFVHNLIAGDIIWGKSGQRRTPYHEEHSTELAGLHRRLGGDNRFYNNVFVGGPGLDIYEGAELPVHAAGNVYLQGAAPLDGEKNSLHLPEFNANIRLAEKQGTVHLHLALPEELADHSTRVVTTELLGKAEIPGLPYENPDGTPLRVTRDYFDASRKADNPAAGPFAEPGTGEVRLRVWPR